MYRMIAGVLAGAALLSFSFARAADPGTLVPGKAMGVTAEQQSNDEADVTITRRIRQAVVKDPGLSFYAQNIKIITIDGLVLLKGPVRSEKERARVESLALDVAGKDNVSSEIEVAD